MTGWEVIVGDSLEVLADLAPESVDAVVCDPPYGLGFMGAAWDTLDGRTTGTQRRVAAGAFDHVGGNHNPVDAADAARTRAVENRKAQAWHEAWARLALRVLKPGGHLLAFGGTRTYHRLACAIEDAGFEIRDTIAWLYGSGFPKSLDVGKAIDAAAGAVRESRPDPRWIDRYPNGNGGTGSGNTVTGGHTVDGPMMTSDPATPDAERWQGWGTALKPAHEPIVVARKPLAGTVAANVLAHGTGALNVDGCRIESGAPIQSAAGAPGFGAGRDDGYVLGTGAEFRNGGRWPANVVLDPEAAAMLDAQTGPLHLAGNKTLSAPTRDGATSQVPNASAGPTSVYGDPGGASRFFYCAKASSAERNAGLDGFEAVPAGSGDERPGGSMHERYGDANGSGRAPLTRNVHPTVKPIALMRWLVRLVTPPGGLILDPFAGSGTTGAAAMLEGFRFAGIERDPEYAAIARARIAWWAEHPEGMELVRRLEAERERKAVAESGQEVLF